MTTIHRAANCAAITCWLAAIVSLLASVAHAEVPPCKLPVLVEPAPEQGMDGIVKAVKGRVVILEDGQEFLVQEETKYFQETGFDLTIAKGIDLGNAVLAVGKPGDEGEFVAERVIKLRFLPGSQGPSGPDRMEWATNAVVEGFAEGWILIDNNRKIPIGKQTKFYVTKNGRNEPADLTAVTKGAMIDFNLSGRPAVLKGQEAGEVTTVWVVVWEVKTR